jgi:hypothetical protein
MRCVPRPVLLLGLLLLAGACDRAPTHAADGSPSAAAPRFYTNATTICTNQAVPSGYVILSAFGSYGCPYYSPSGMNAYNIAIPGTQEDVCSNSPIPSGYVIQGTNNGASCPGYSPSGRNMWIIKIPGMYETVCGNSPVPSGYIVTSYTSSVACPGYPNNAKNIQRV